MTLRGPRAPKDFWAGLLFIGIGVGFALAARHYPMGTTVRMGPAYFPTVVGGLLAVLGLIILGNAFVREGPAVPRSSLRPFLLVPLAVVLFGLLLKPGGLVLASVVLVVVGALGGSEIRWKEVVVLGVLLAAFSVATFVKGLGLPIPVWPGE
ncbi:MAG TPA: tripartite tricarboxylate transporter TctB family protein [Methylomirabilota bacterium]|nr:tripartite tricarboxylate transporter TctB family protein [Methylomirabilota bacterium]